MRKLMAATHRKQQLRDNPGPSGHKTGHGTPIHAMHTGSQPGKVGLSLARCFFPRNSRLIAYWVFLPKALACHRKGRQTWNCPLFPHPQQVAEGALPLFWVWPQELLSSLGIWLRKLSQSPPPQLFPSPTLTQSPPDVCLCCSCGHWGFLSCPSVLRLPNKAANTSEIIVRGEGEALPGLAERSTVFLL